MTSKQRQRKKKKQQETSLEGWANIILSLGAQKQDELKKFWKERSEQDLSCTNARMTNLAGEEYQPKAKAAIKCALTAKACVCSYYSQTVNGFVLAEETARNCPGFKKRSKRTKIV